MKCTEAIERLEDHLDRLLPLPEADALERHVALCENCRRALQAERDFRTLLHAQPVPAPRAGFAARVLARARASEAAPRRVSFAAGFTSAAALALLAWFLVVPMQSTVAPDAPAPAVPEVRMALNEVKSVHLVFQVPDEIADSTMSLQLPEHVELRGYPGRRALTWHTALKSGANSLSLPIVAQQAASGDLEVRISYGTKQQVFHVRLNVRPADAAGIPGFDARVHTVDV
ncbi:MAG: zf-HC2 domain-containing protein [Burkholderiales bacterium]